MILSPGDGETPVYGEGCVLCEVVVTHTRPAGLLAELVAHYDTAHRITPDDTAARCRHCDHREDAHYGFGDRSPCHLNPCECADYEGADW